MKIEFRDITKEDEPFIFSSWLNSSWLHHLHDVKKTIFFQKEKAEVSNIIQKNTIKLAVDPDTPKFIYGYICYNRPDKETLIIHYIYVKEPFRTFGLANKLIHEASKNGATDIFTTYNKGKRTESLMKKYLMLYKPQLRSL